MSAAAAVPKSFNQLRLLAQVGAMSLGGWVGLGQKKENDALWAAHFRSQWAAKAKVIEEQIAAEKAKLPPAAIPEMVPEELHELYKELSK